MIKKIFTVEKILSFLPKRLKINFISLFNKLNSPLLKKNDYIFYQKCNFKILKKLKDKIKTSKKIRVAFIIDTAEKFPANTIYNKMLKDNFFEPFILIVPPNNDMNLYNRAFNKISASYRNVFKTYDDKGNVINYLDKIDLAILQTQDDTIYPKIYRVYNLIKNKILTCIVYYAWCIVDIYGIVNTDTANLVWKFFIESDYTLDEFKKLQAINAQNMVVSGYAKMDSMFDIAQQKRSRKRVLVCSHHTIFNNEYYSCFLQYADLFQRLPKMYPQIDFIFRPHPLLKRNLSFPSIWGPKKTEKYFEELLKNPNVFFDDNAEYMETFVNSDAIIQDCGSFSAEYLFTGHPQCYLIKDKSNIKKYYNTIGKKCLQHSYLAFKESNIINFMDNVVILKKDPMKKQRDIFVQKKLKINYPNASGFIISYLKNQILE